MPIRPTRWSGRSRRCARSRRNGSSSCSARAAIAIAASAPRWVRWPCGSRAPAKLSFGGVATDPRDLRPGALFVALKGDRFDAHAFLDQARANGASAAVVRRGTPAVDGLPYFEVADTLDALGLLARARR